MYELQCGPIGNVNPALRKGITGNGFVGSFVSQDILAHLTAIPHRDVLLENIAQRFDVNPAALNRFLLTSYENELHEFSEKDLNVQALNDI